MAKKPGRRSFGSAYRLPSDRWHVRYTGPDGRRRNAPHTFGTRLEAEAWIVAKRREIDRDTWDATAEDTPRRAPMTFGAYAAGWLAGRHVAGRPIKPRTRAHYQNILDDHLLPTFGNRQLSAISPADVRTWHGSTLVDKPTMRSHSYSLLRTIFASAVNDELVQANPCRITGAGRTNRVVKIKPASVDEIAALTNAMPERLQLMVLLASWCALRFGECVELRRGDIDLSAETIHIRRAAVRVRGRYQIGTPKSEASIRDVAIPPHLIPVIEDHLARYVGAERDSLLFPAGGENSPGEENSSRHLQPSTLARHWYKARHAAGRDDLRFHDLRHSSLVLAALTGATLRELMDRAGHSSASAAMRYQHTVAGRDKEIAQLLSKLANGM